MAAPPRPRSISCSSAASARTGTASTRPRLGIGTPAARSNCRSIPAARRKPLRLGPDLAAGERPQVVVPPQPGKPPKASATGRCVGARSRRDFEFKLRPGAERLEPALSALPGGYATPKSKKFAGFSTGRVYPVPIDCPAQFYRQRPGGRARELEVWSNAAVVHARILAARWGDTLCIWRRLRARRRGLGRTDARAGRLPATCGNRWYGQLHCGRRHAHHIRRHWQ